MFLDYINPRHFYRLSTDILKTTEGINVNTAQLCVQACSHPFKKQEKEVKARLIPFFTNTNNVFVSYKTDHYTFDNVPFPQSPPIIERLQIVAEEVVTREQEEQKEKENTPHEKPIKEPFSQTLLDKTFTKVSPGTVIRIVSTGTLRPTYQEPFEGTALPLWSVGVSFPVRGDLSAIESLFVFPSLTSLSGRPSLDVRFYPLCDILKKDPLFAQGNVEKFRPVQEGFQPWNLVQAIEEGALSFSMKGNRYTSFKVRRDVDSFERVFIVFKNIPSH
jgi:hypothetical protein